MKSDQWHRNPSFHFSLPLHLFWAHSLLSPSPSAVHSSQYFIIITKYHNIEERKVRKLQMTERARQQHSSELECFRTIQTGKLQRRRSPGGALWILLVGFLIGSPGWAQNRQRPARPSPKPSAVPKNPAPPAAPLPSFTQEELQGMQAVLETSRGQIVLEFYADLAPSHVTYFAGLVKTGFYDGTTFHRVILRGIIQGGDPLSKDPMKKSLYGTGGLQKLKSEFNKQAHARGTVSAVLLPGDPNSAGSQFFICVSDQRQLDGQYTAWGHVVEGMEVVDKISESPAGLDQMA